MARRQAEDYDKKLDAIMREAAKLFAKKGFDGASLSDLAAACGVSKSLIYHYYASKEAILFDVMNAHIDQLVDVVRSLDNDHETPEDTFRALARALMRAYVGAANSQKVLLYELENLPGQQRSEIVRKQREIIDFAESLLKSASPLKEKNHHRLRAHTMLFFGMLNWTHNWFRSSGAIDRDEIADMAARSALHAVRDDVCETAT